MSSINTQKNIVFVGGDARQITAARMLSLRGWRVSTFLGGDFDVAFERYETLESALIDADTVVLPLPVSVDAKSLNAPFLENEQITLSRIFDALSLK